MNLSSFKTNWSTTVTGGLVALSGFTTFVAGFAAQLGALGALIPEKQRGEVLLIGGIATALSTTLHGALTKSASVSGNGTLNEPAKVAQSDGSNKTLSPLLAALLFPAFFFTGCTTLNAQKGTYYTNADNVDTHLRFMDGKITSYDSGSNLHSPIIREYSHGVERVAKTVVNGLITYSTMGAAPVASAIPSTVDSFLNRPTNRVPPATPAPTPIKAH